jgi:hypothetical protein
MSAIVLPFPLSLPERRLWNNILAGGGRGRRRRWPDWLAFIRKNPFSAGSNVNSAEVEQQLAHDNGNQFPWLYPTSDFQHFDKYSTVALPAIAGTPAGFTSITQGANQNFNLPFTVPAGYNGFIKTVGIDFVANGGAAWTQGVIPQQLAFRILVNGVPATDYGNFAFSPGTVPSPTALAGVPIKEKNVVEVDVWNLAIAVTTQFVEARLQGYFYGKHLEPKDMWQ